MLWYYVIMIRKRDLINEQTKQKCIDEIIARVEEQDGALFGNIASQDVIDIVAKYLGPQEYNHGLEDAKKAIQDKLSDLEIDIDILRVNL